jgi:hypothetical protein
MASGNNITVTVKLRDEVTAELRFIIVSLWRHRLLSNTYRLMRQYRVSA